MSSSPDPAADADALLDSARITVDFFGAYAPLAVKMEYAQASDTLDGLYFPRWDRERGLDLAALSQHGATLAELAKAAAKARDTTQTSAAAVASAWSGAAAAFADERLAAEARRADERAARLAAAAEAVRTGAEALGAAVALKATNLLIAFPGMDIGGYNAEQVYTLVDIWLLGKDGDNSAAKDAIERAAAFFPALASDEYAHVNGLFAESGSLRHGNRGETVKRAAQIAKAWLDSVFKVEYQKRHEALVKESDACTESIRAAYADMVAAVPEEVPGGGGSGDGGSGAGAGGGSGSGGSGDSGGGDPGVGGGSGASGGASGGSDSGSRGDSESSAGGSAVGGSGGGYSGGSGNGSDGGYSGGTGGGSSVGTGASAAEPASPYPAAVVPETPYAGAIPGYGQLSPARGGAALAELVAAVGSLKDALTPLIQEAVAGLTDQINGLAEAFAPEAGEEPPAPEDPAPQGGSAEPPEDGAGEPGAEAGEPGGEGDEPDEPGDAAAEDDSFTVTVDGKEWTVRLAEDGATVELTDGERTSAYTVTVDDGGQPHLTPVEVAAPAPQGGEPAGETDAAPAQPAPEGDIAPSLNLGPGGDAAACEPEEAPGGEPDAAPPADVAEPDPETGARLAEAGPM